MLGWVGLSNGKRVRNYTLCDCGALMQPDLFTKRPGPLQGRAKVPHTMTPPQGGTERHGSGKDWENGKG